MLRILLKRLGWFFVIAMIVGQIVSTLLYLFAEKQYYFETTILLKRPFVRPVLFPEDTSNPLTWSREGYYFLNSVLNDNFLQMLLLKYAPLKEDLKDFYHQSYGPEPLSSAKLSEDEIQYYIQKKFKDSFKIQFLGVESGTFFVRFQTPHQAIGKDVVKDVIRQFELLARKQHLQLVESSLERIEQLLAEKSLASNSDHESEIRALLKSKTTFMLLLELVRVDASYKFDVISEPFTPPVPSFPTKEMAMGLGIIFGILFYWGNLLLRQWVRP